MGAHITIADKDERAAAAAAGHIRQEFARCAAGIYSKFAASSSTDCVV